MMEDPSAAAGGLSLVAFAIVMMVVAIAAVSVRVWMRALTRSFWWDDWMVIIALPFSIVQNALHIYAVQQGLGQHMHSLPPDSVTGILRTLWISYFFTNAGISIPKAAALLLYARVFTTKNQAFRYALWIAHTLNVLWYLSSIARVLLFCYPIQKYWDTSIAGFCRNADALYLGSAIPSVVIDVFILILPLPMMWRLNLRANRKILLTGAFVCAYIVPAISIGRLITSAVLGSKLNDDFTFYGKSLIFWVTAEPAISILSICLPACFALSSRAREKGMMSLFVAEEISEAATQTEDQRMSDVVLLRPTKNRRLRPFSMSTYSEDRIHENNMRSGKMRHLSLGLGNSEPLTQEIRESLDHMNPHPREGNRSALNMNEAFLDLESGDD